MEFVKTTNGNILLQNGGDTLQVWPNTGTRILLSGDESAIIIQQSLMQSQPIFAADVSQYEIQPAAPVAFSGTASELIDILQEFFFTNSSSISGDVVVTNTPNVSVTNTPDVNVLNTPDVNVVNTPTVDINGTPTITFDTPFVDAFGRLRTSHPTTIFDSKMTVDNGAIFWDDQQTSGAGTTSVHSVNGANVTMSVGNLTAGTRVRQTRRWFNYQPGKSQQVFLTGVLGKPATGITRRIGLFNALNGVFFESRSTGTGVVVRTNVSGSPTDTFIAQTFWNYDKMTGGGVSGINLDFAKAQIFFIDFEWLGEGTIAFGFFVNRKRYYCHFFHVANVFSVVSFSNPNLPLRYEISNSGTGAADSLIQVCSTVQSEGGHENTGFQFGINRDVNALTTGNNANLYPLLGIRLRSGYLSSQVKPLDFSIICNSTATFNWYFILNPTITGTALVWTDVTNSSCQAMTTSTNGTTATAGTGTIVKSGTMIASGAADSSNNIASANDLFLGSSIAGVSDELYLVVQRTTTAAETFFAALNFLDQK